jgi:phytoene desaturase
MKKATVIGSGFSGISAASFLARDGWDVTVVERHDTPGGRARQMEIDGFSFDMGPSWYWMPDVFDEYFQKLGSDRSVFYDLTRLDPSYSVYWSDDKWTIPADYQQLCQLFEDIEPGSSERLSDFLKEAAFKYEAGMKNLVFKPGLSLTEFMDSAVFKGVMRLDIFTSMRKHIRRYFKNTRLQQLLEFPVLFLGAMPDNIPALYSLMNYADIKLGTWYPRGGMYAVVEGMVALAKQLGVKFVYSTDVTKIEVDESTHTAHGVHLSSGVSVKFFESDVIVATGDYNHVEQQLLEPRYRNYSTLYWEKKVMAPSCLLFFVGLNKRLKNIHHHSLFFDVDFNQHGEEIYKDPQWPKEPLFYVCAPSQTDVTVAPDNCENLFFLVPIASGLSGDTEDCRKPYFEKICSRFEQKIGQEIKNSIVVLKSYGLQNFVDDYNAFKGNAYGLANTLNQTANLKPSCRNKKVKNLFYAGQLTVPGPGVPPSLISGEVVARLIQKVCGKDISKAKMTTLS